MQRLLRVPVVGAGPGERALPAEATAYLRVHRARAGLRFVAVDAARAVECDAELLELGPPARARLGEARAGARPLREVTLLQGLGKGDKPETVLRAATALGATGVVLLVTERAVARPEASAARHQRWVEVTRDEARQSGRGDLPALSGPLSLAEGLARLGPAAADERRVVLLPGAVAPLPALLRGSGPVRLLIGPEGGLAPAEVAAAEAAGFVPGSLGRFVLRTELAAIAALAVVAAPGDG